MVHRRTDELLVLQIAHPDYLGELEEPIFGRKRAGRPVALYDATVVQRCPNPLAARTPVEFASKPTNIALLLKVSRSFMRASGAPQELLARAELPDRSPNPSQEVLLCRGRWRREL